MALLFDYIFPKHYFWHRGFDSMYGAIARWVRKLGERNHSLTELDCLLVVKSLFGLHHWDSRWNSLKISCLMKHVEHWTPIADYDKVTAWVSTGRRPHVGDAMTAWRFAWHPNSLKESGTPAFPFSSRSRLGRI